MSTLTDVTEDEKILSNLYVSTVNAAGLYYPTQDGIASVEAGRTAVLAGARGFVFDIWPDLTAGGRFAPVIQFVEEGSKWRRSSLNRLSFATVLRGIVQETLEVPARPGSNDPVFFYLRFRDTPRPATFLGVMNALRAICEQYRLPPSYNACNMQGNVASLKLSELRKKIVVFSNIRTTGTGLDDYINVAPTNGIVVEKSWADVKTTQNDAAARIAMQTDSMANLLWLAPSSESNMAENNGIDVEIAQTAGVQFVAMNFWNRTTSLAAYMDKGRFGVSSFGMKSREVGRGERLRRTVERIAPPAAPSPSVNVQGMSVGGGTAPRR